VLLLDEEELLLAGVVLEEAVDLLEGDQLVVYRADEQAGDFDFGHVFCDVQLVDVEFGSLDDYGFDVVDEQLD
jgi:hypothetical protein